MDSIHPSGHVPGRDEVPVGAAVGQWEEVGGR